MAGEEANDVKEQETVEPEVETAAADETSQPEPGSKEFNWRRLEGQVSELKRQNDELKQAITQPRPAPVEPQEEIHLEDDDLVTYSQLNRLAEQKAKKIFTEELDKREKAKLPERTKAKYSDYEAIVTPENVEKLIKEDPDLEHDIAVAKNPYARAYKAIKQAEFYRSAIKGKESNDKLETNSRKPVSSNSIGKDRPLAHAEGYSKGSKDLFAEMQKFRGGSL